MADFPKIGDFASGPENNSPRLPRKEEPRDAVLDDLVKETMTEIEKELRPPTAEEIENAYVKGLREVDLDIVGARQIMEDILVNGYYEEKVKLGTLSVVLRTRTYNDTVRMTRFLEVEAPTYTAGVQDLIARYNTVSSLRQFGDKVFNIPEDTENAKLIEESFDERYKFLLRKPSAVVGRLMNMVYKFDLKIAAVFAEGAPQDF